MKILFVDDDEVLCKIFVEWLETLGHQVVLANDGLEGILFFNDCRPDLVITDFQMPYADGASLTHHVKSQNQGIPVIMFTGYCDRFTREKAKQIGVSEYLTKPIMFERLKQILDTYNRHPAKDSPPDIVPPN